SCKPLRNHHLLLVTTRKSGNKLLDIRHPHTQLASVLLGQATLRGTLDEKARKQARQDRQRHVRSDGEVQHQALLVAVLRYIRHARPECVGGRGEAKFTSTELHSLT